MKRNGFYKRILAMWLAAVLMLTPFGTYSFTSYAQEPDGEEEIITLEDQTEPSGGESDSGMGEGDTSGSGTEKDDAPGTGTDNDGTTGQDVTDPSRDDDGTDGASGDMTQDGDQGSGSVDDPTTGEDEETSAQDDMTLPDAETDESAVIFEMEDEEILIPTDDLPDADELYEQYFERTMYGNRGRGPLRAPRKQNLTEEEQRLYTYLLTEITKIANGEREDTVITVPAKQILNIMSYPWTDYGIETPFVNGQLTEEAKAVMQSVIFGSRLTNVINALLTDVPYELYWYDKTDTGGIGASLSAVGRDRTGFYIPDDATYSFSMMVAKEYSLTGQNKTTKANTKITGATKAAANRAASIVDDAELLYTSDYDKMKYYFDQICYLTDYNRDAADDDKDTPYGNPWQLVWVFDDNPDTTVVCEGYSKAFKYLCDKTQFLDNDVEVYIMTGKMQGGGHMWNSVRMDDGNYYLVDVTNCDMYRTGTPTYALFLKGYERLYKTADGDPAGYDYYRSGTLTYEYDKATMNGFSAEERTMSATDYEPTSTAESYRVSFDPGCNDNSVVITELRLKYVVPGHPYGSLPVATRSGYAFDGWYTAAKGGEKITESTIVNVTGDQTLYAHWKEKHTVSFRLSGGSFPAGTSVQEEIEDSDKLTHPADPVRRGYEFTGWYTDPEGGNKYDFDTPVTGLLILYAGWQLEVPEVRVDNARVIKTDEEDRTIDVSPETPVELSHTGADVSVYYILCGPDADEIAAKDKLTTYDFLHASDLKNERIFLYTQEIIISEDTIIVAVAYKEGENRSDVLISYKYQVQQPEGDVTEDDLKAGGYTTVKDIPSDKLWVVGIKDENYTGSPITFDDLRVYHHTKLLTKGKDYTVTYKNNTKEYELKEGDKEFRAAKAPTVVIKGKGNYSGQITRTFIINAIPQIPISKVKVSSIPTQKWTGKEITPDFTLKYGGVKLEEGDDYTYECRNNKSAGTAEIVIEGKGDYTGTRTVKFKIKGTSISGVKVTGLVNTPYTGKVIEPEPKATESEPEGFTVTLGKKPLSGVPVLRQAQQPEVDADYTYRYENNISAGTARLIITGTGAYTGTVKKTWKITPYNIQTDAENQIEVKWKDPEDGTELDTDPVRQFAYQKNGTKPVPVVRFKGYYIDEAGDLQYGWHELTAGKDYTVGNYSGNKKQSDNGATLVITGKGNFTGKRKISFGVTGQSLENTTMTAADVVYTGKTGKYKASVVIRDVNGAALKNGTDYTVTGYYYTEETELNTQIVRKAGDPVDAKDIVPAGTILRVTVKGKGNYDVSGSEQSAEYRIINADISKASVKVNTQYYTGREIRPGKNQIVVTLAGRVLSDVDYEIVSYTNNINKGTAKLTIRGTGYYGKEKTVSFKIADRSMYYNVSFNGNGATSGSPVRTQMTPGKEYTLKKNPFNRKNYKFAEWNTKADGTGESYTDRQKITAGDAGEALILYAQWIPDTFTITWHPDGGDNHDNDADNDDVTKYTVEDGPFMLRSPVKPGYRFAGWFTDKKLKNRITVLRKGTSGNFHLYAKWEYDPDYTGVYEGEDGVWRYYRGGKETEDTYTGIISNGDRLLYVDNGKMSDEVSNSIESKKKNILDYGATANDWTDDTYAINQAIKEADETQGGGIVYIPAGTYLINGNGPNMWDDYSSVRLDRVDDVTIVMEQDTVLKLITNNYKNYSVIFTRYANNITIIGGQIVGDRASHVFSGGSTHEGGHGIGVYASDNVNIIGVTVRDCTGDGIYLGISTPDDDVCNTVEIKGCNLTNNRRNNLSIVAADNVTVDGCMINAANGTSPQWGIDIEPNRIKGIIRPNRNITILNTEIYSYKNITGYRQGEYMTAGTAWMKETSAENVIIKGCTFHGDFANYSAEGMEISDTVITGIFYRKRDTKLSNVKYKKLDTYCWGL